MTADTTQHLLDKKAELINSQKESRPRLEVTRFADTLDSIQQQQLADLAVGNLNHTAKTLALIDAALDRLREGSYGVCLECGESINPKRLAALPWAPLCVRCQESLDKN